MKFSSLTFFFKKKEIHEVFFACFLFSRRRKCMKFSLPAFFQKEGNSCSFLRLLSFFKKKEIHEVFFAYFLFQEEGNS